MKKKSLKSSLIVLHFLTTSDKEEKYVELIEKAPETKSMMQRISPSFMILRFWNLTQNQKLIKKTC